MNDEETRTGPEDELGHNDPLVRNTTIPVLGIPVTFESNDTNVIDVAEAAFGIWHRIEHTPRLISEMRVRFRIHVEQAGAAGEPGGHAQIVYRVPDRTRVFLRTTASMGVADASRREAILYTTAALVADRQHFRYGVLEALTLAVLTRLDRQPLHAACITRGDTALLLAGPSGSGKSTLAFTAARAGYGVLTDDHVNIQLRPRLRVWGMPGHLHLPTDAARHFPELEYSVPTLLANGKEKIVINITDLGAAPDMPVALRAGVCVLAPPGGDEPVLETLEPDALQAALIADLDPGFDLFTETIGECIRMLVSQGGWKLHPGSDPERSLEHIESMFEVLSD